MLDVMLDAYVQYLESVFRVVRAASAASGTLVRAFIVVDCSGLSLSTIRNIGVIKKVASIGPVLCGEHALRVDRQRADALRGRVGRRRPAAAGAHAEEGQRAGHGLPAHRLRAH